MKFEINAYLCVLNARMAELVDALVSNTNRFTPVPVRSRLRVLWRGKFFNFPRFLFGDFGQHLSIFCGLPNTETNIRSPTGVC